MTALRRPHWKPVEQLTVAVSRVVGAGRSREEVTDRGNAEADAYNNRCRGPSWHVRRRRRRCARRGSRIERHDRDTSRTWPPHRASPQWAELKPSSDLRRRRRGHRCLPMRRKEAFADLSCVLRCSQPGTFVETPVSTADPSTIGRPAGAGYESWNLVSRSSKAAGYLPFNTPLGPLPLGAKGSQPQGSVREGFGTVSSRARY